MKPAFVVLCRDKEKHVRMACESVLNQTYPCHVIFSNQGSVDKTPEIIKDLAANYKGHHEVSVIECPVTEPKGMSGCNAHLDWLFTNLDEEIIMISAADDWSHPTRAARTVKAFEETGADYVCTGMVFNGADGSFKNAQFEGDCKAELHHVLFESLGGSTSMALRKSYYAKIKPLPAVITNDMYLPCFATLMGGCYYIHDPLQMHIRHADPNNTGLGGRILAAKTEEEKEVLQELVQFQMSATWYAIADKMLELGLGTPEQCAQVGTRAWMQSKWWVDQRKKLTERRWSPIPLPA